MLNKCYFIRKGVKVGVGETARLEESLDKGQVVLEELKLKLGRTVEVTEVEGS